MSHAFAAQIQSLFGTLYAFDVFMEQHLGGLPAFFREQTDNNSPRHFSAPCIYQGYPAIVILTFYRTLHSPSPWEAAEITLNICSQAA